MEFGRFAHLGPGIMAGRAEVLVVGGVVGVVLDGLEGCPLGLVGLADTWEGQPGEGGGGDDLRLPTVNAMRRQYNKSNALERPVPPSSAVLAALHSNYENKRYRCDVAVLRRST